MRNQIKISNFQGKLTLEIPQHWDSEILKDWKKTNRKIIDLAKQSANGHYLTINLKN